MLKLYTDRKWLPTGYPHLPLLQAFWGPSSESPPSIYATQYARLIAQARDFVSLTSLDEADAALAPVDWSHVRNDRRAQKPLLELADQAAQRGKRTVVMFQHDSVQTVPIRTALIFRASMYRSQRYANEFAMPAWFEDLVENYLGGQLPLRAKQEKPVVGFCGAPGLPRLSPVKRTRQALRGIAFRVARALGKRIAPPNVGRQPRRRTLDLLAQSQHLSTNFVFRERFFGGAIPGECNDAARLLQVRRDFVENMVESDYTVCVRGAGNWSIRFYETLCCGRIPIFVDTDCVLPFEEYINWRDYCVWVDEAELPRIGEKVAEFHARLSPREFTELQRSCRRLWEEWLSPLGFHAQMHRYITG